MSKTVFFFHGAWASPLGFAYISDKLIASFDDILLYYFDYNTNTETLNDVVERAKVTLSEYEDVVVVGHSLGGIIALLLSSHPSVREVVTISSPLSGIKFPLILHYYMTSTMVKSIAQESNLIYELKNRTYTKPVTVIASTKGFSPAIYEPNDGVVTIKSQTSWTPAGSTITEIETNHHEILQHSLVSKIICDII